jgi:hypothetical protein
MTLSDIASIGGIVSSGAVALSLFYVATQVRQAERNQRGLMQQGRADRVSGMLLHLAQPGAGSIWVKGLHQPQTLSASELEYFLLACRAAFISAEDSFLQHAAGLLDEAVFRSFSAGLTSQFASTPSLRASWRLLSGGFGAEFTAFMNAALDETASQEPLDRLPQWQAVLQAEAGTGKIGVAAE